MEPLIVSAVVTASGSLLNTVLAHALNRQAGSAATKVMKKTYPRLAAEVTTNSLRVLIVLHEAQTQHMPKQIRSRASAVAKRQEPDGNRYELDLTYRLTFLSTLGLIGRS